jgi:hypothetical protein
MLKIIVLLVMLVIFASLVSALVFLFRGGKANDHRMAKALTWRIGLSLTLFLLLMAGFYFGIITPHGP